MILRRRELNLLLAAACCVVYGMAKFLLSQMLTICLQLNHHHRYNSPMNLQWKSLWLRFLRHRHKAESCGHCNNKNSIVLAAMHASPIWGKKNTRNVRILKQYINNRWNCRNCNASSNVNSLLNAATTDLSQQAGQPVIKLSGLTNARRDINDRVKQTWKRTFCIVYRFQLLFCEGRYQASTAQGIETKIVSAEALIQVAYMNKPYIIDATTRKLPVRDRNSGNRFLVRFYFESTINTVSSGTL